MNAAVLDELDSLSNKLNEWKCNLFVDSVDAEGKSIKIDLITRLIPNEKVQQILVNNHCFPSKTWHRFPKAFDGLQGRDKLIKMITDSAKECGFVLMVANK